MLAPFHIHFQAHFGGLFFDFIFCTCYTTNMKRYDYVEDYLEVISGKLDVNLKSPHNAWFVTFQPIINLARYDTNFLDNVTDATINGSALTDRQAELAVKLISKYHRQLAAHQIDIGDMTMPRYRKPLRIIDRNKSASVQDDAIALKFPYQAGMIETIRDAAKHSQGKIRFDREAKYWKIALTEYNVNWVCAFARANEFEIDDRLTDFMKRIIESEAAGYSITLMQDGSRYYIMNAAESLNNHVQEHIGFDNVLALIDNSDLLGYQVSEDILQQAEQDLGPSTFLLARNREYDFNNATGIAERIVKYAHAVNRWPIVVFNPTPEHTLDEWKQYFAPEEILEVGNKKDLDISPAHKIIYSHRPLKTLEHIPLLVTHVGMMIGAEKQYMMQRSEKIFYTAAKLKS